MLIDFEENQRLLKKHSDWASKLWNRYASLRHWIKGDHIQASRNLRTLSLKNRQLLAILDLGAATRRGILSVIASVYDRIGFLFPDILTGKKSVTGDVQKRHWMRRTPRTF